MKSTGYFIPRSDEKLAFVRLGAVQNQISGSEDIDFSAHTNLSNEHGVIDCAKANSKYIEILEKYSIFELSNNDIVRLIDPKNTEEITKNLLPNNEDYSNK